MTVVGYGKRLLTDQRKFEISVPHGLPPSASAHHVFPTIYNTNTMIWAGASVPLQLCWNGGTLVVELSKLLDHTFQIRMNFTIYSNSASDGHRFQDSESLSHCCRRREMV
jgi:hypothetical protein